MKHFKHHSLLLIAILATTLLLPNTLLAQTTELKFNTDRKFKIVQFTDIHWVYGNSNSDVAGERMAEVLDAEKPDLVVITGDLIFARPASKALEKALEPIIKRGLKFAVTWGNHDDEQDMARAQLSDYIKDMPGNLTSTTEGVAGVTNYILPIGSSEGNYNAATLYVFDSRTYSTIDGVKGYGWIENSQIEWYKRSSKAFTEKNGGKPLPSLAFFHIPIPEYNEAAADAGNYLVGTRKEKACSPAINSGLGAAMLECKDVMGVFVGHDHINDYVTNWRGILLCYGRYTGGNTVYNNMPGGNGARIIELTEGERGFKTWIRIKEGKIINEVNFPADTK
ncbi:MAG: metallophosphoesterase family protein [Alistipes sp.]|nr:metallophosphoesterase family protein [Alistipes sp.]